MYVIKMNNSHLNNLWDLYDLRDLYGLYNLRDHQNECLNPGPSQPP